MCSCGIGRGVDCSGHRRLLALFDALTDETGHVKADLKARDGLKALAEGLAPRQGSRLERLRLDPTRPWLPVACACRLATLDSGETVLVTALVGPVPKMATRSRPAQAQEGSVGPAAPSSEAARGPAPLPERPLGPIRFIWQADGQTRFTEVSPELAAAVGPAAGDIVGLTWEEVARSFVEDQDGAVAALFARRGTWSGHTVFWNIDHSTLQVPVDWAGMPVFAANRDLIGFRGFGLLRMDAARERSAPEEPRLHIVVPSLLADETLPFRPPEEPAPEAEASDEDGWFADLRDQVAEALSVSNPPQPKDEHGGAGKRPVAAPPSSLSNAERSAFREIARALGARLEEDAPSQSERPVEAVSPSSPHGRRRTRRFR
ncbi:hypothetical protein ACFQY9_07350 [Microvirga aerilata]|uniref:hypothetical protein n=1 Tax=Microvirga aerilata TaxID=670292 RepID=UPI003634FB91